MVKAQKALVIWTELNARQQAYLKLIYQVDQETERDEKRSGFTGQRRPALGTAMVVLRRCGAQQSQSIEAPLEKSSLGCSWHRQYILSFEAA